MIRGIFTTTNRGYTGEIRFFGTREQVELRPIGSMPACSTARSC